MSATPTTAPAPAEVMPPAAALPAVAEQPALPAAVPDQNYEMGFETTKGFELVQRAAKLLASSSLVPKDYQQNVPNCVIALNMAHRMKADPLMVMQNLYVVHGKPGWSSQFLIATFNSSGRFTSLRFEYEGETGTDNWRCRAMSLERETGELLTGTWVSMAMANAEGWVNKQGSKWKTMPEQMMMYRAASFFVRAYAPELAMGFRTVEEIKDMSEPDDEPSVIPAKFD